MKLGDNPECNRRVVIPAADCGERVPTVEERVAKLEGKVQTMDIDVKQHFAEFRVFVVESLEGVEKRLTAQVATEIAGQVGGLEARLGARLDRVDTRLDRVDARFDLVDARFHSIDTRFNNIDARFNNVDARFDRIDGRLDRVDVKLDRIDTKLDVLVRAIRGGSNAE